MASKKRKSKAPSEAAHDTLDLTQEYVGDVKIEGSARVIPVPADESRQFCKLLVRENDLEAFMKLVLSPYRDEVASIAQEKRALVDGWRSRYHFPRDATLTFDGSKGAIILPDPPAGADIAV